MSTVVVATVIHCNIQTCFYYTAAATVNYYSTAAIATGTTSTTLNMCNLFVFPTLIDDQIIAIGLSKQWRKTFAIDQQAGESVD